MKRLVCQTLLACALGILPGLYVHAEPLPEAIQAVQARGASVVGRFDAPAGLQGYAARYDGQAVALYLTADGKHVLIGSLLDEQGKDLSQAPLERLVYEPLGKELWARLQASTWIADGRDDAPRVIYVFSDPNCPYCSLFWKQARPWVEAGKVQLRHIMVGMLRPDSAGKAAALLAAKDPRAALDTHEAAGKASKLEPLAEVPQRLQQQLDANLELMHEMGGAATPAIYFMDARGRLQQQQGAPRPEALEALMAPGQP